jgi:hypothetical protein
VSRDLALFVTANLGEKGSSILQLDMPALGLVGKYTVTEMQGTDLNNFMNKPYGTTDNGTINSGPLGKYEIRGYKLERIKTKSYLFFY